MNKSDIPKPYELARLAALVFSQCTARDLASTHKHGLPTASTREEESVKLAARLWMHSTELCKKLTDTIGSDTSKVWDVVGGDKMVLEFRVSSHFSTLLKIGTDEQTSEVLRWVRANATTKKDSNLPYDSLIQAMKNAGMQTLLPVSEDELRNFLSLRKAERSKQRATARHRQSGQQKSKRRLS